MLEPSAGGRSGAIAKQRQKSRLSARDWLKAALALATETGIPGLKVQDLAASLGATTGSLYWHFEDRRALEMALLEYWAEESTEAIIRQIEAGGEPPAERLWRVLVLVQGNRPTAADVAIRGWAAHDEEAAKVVRRVDARRAEVAGGLFRAMGFRGDEAKMRTQLMLCYESCEHFVLSDVSPKQRRRLLRARFRLYCQPLS